MLNKLWPVFIIVSVICSIMLSKVDEINQSIFESANTTINVTLTLIGSTCLWNGIMKIACNLNCMKKISSLLNPVINFLFPDLKSCKSIKQEISANIIANVLGLGNAATPLGLKAMNSLQEKNVTKEKLSNSMMMLILLNTASIQIIPTTVIAIRKSLGSENCTGIILPVWCTTISAAISGIVIVKLLAKHNS